MSKLLEGAAYKGKLLGEMTREELLVVIAELYALLASQREAQLAARLGSLKALSEPA